MTRTILVLLAATAVAAPALADSPFDGTWRVDPADMKVHARPSVWTIAGSTYSCKTCLPTPYTVKANGAYQPVKGRPYWDDVAITIVDPSTVNYKFRKAGKLVSETTSRVSADGNTLVSETMSTANGAGSPVNATSSLKRLAPAPKGAHAVSGSWDPAPPTQVSSNALTLDLRIDGDTITTKSPLGETLVAKFGGPYVLNAGDPGRTMTKAERISATAYRLTDMSGGKVVSIATYTLSPDGKTIEGAWRDPRDGSSGSWIARRQ